MYIHEKNEWTKFYWNHDDVSLMLDEVCRELGKLYGRLENIGFDNKLRITADSITNEIIHSSEIEGIKLNTDEVRSSIANRLGIKSQDAVFPSHDVDAVAEMMMDAINHYDSNLSKERLCQWQAALFPTGRSNGIRIEVGKYRTCEEQIVSGAFGHERVHYVAPAPERVESEMEQFVNWFNAPKTEPAVICSAIAHLWFVSIHPFEDGNGRLARTVAEIMLARGDSSSMRFYSMSSAICSDKKKYYDILETTQRGNGDITQWLVWFIATLKDAVDSANSTLTITLNKSVFWMQFAGIPISSRQRDVLNVYLDGYSGKMTSKNYAHFGKCSQDTALRDLQDLDSKQMIKADNPAAKRKSYSINYNGANEDKLSTRLSKIAVVDDDRGSFITAVIDGTRQLKETLIAIDAARIRNGEISPEDLAHKYFAYLAD